jgi:hypothetical protein
MSATIALYLVGIVMPPVIPPSVNAGQEGIMVPIVEVKLQRNTNWNFEIHLCIAHGGGFQLGIHGQGGSFDIRTTGAGFLSLPGIPDEQFSSR